MNGGEFLSDYYKGMRSSETDDKNKNHPSRQTQQYSEQREEVQNRHSKRRKGVYVQTHDELQNLDHDRSPSGRESSEIRGVGNYRQIIKELIVAYLPNSVIDESLALSIIQQESKYDTNARSHTGVRGLCQITKQTVRHIVASNRDRGSDGLFISDELTGHRGRIDYQAALKPINQIKLMLSYLSQIESQFDFIRNSDFKKDVIIASYNLGPGKVSSILRNHRIDTTSELKSAIASARGVSRSKKHETINYIAQINRNMDRYA